MSVSVGRLLSPPTDASSILVKPGQDGRPPSPFSPAEVAAQLNRLFPFEVSTEQYFTLVYGVLDTSTGEFCYTLAGHPGPIYLPIGGQPKLLPGRGYPIGLADGPKPYNEWTVRLSIGDRLYLYSDGVPEAVSPEGNPYGTERLLEQIEVGRSDPLCAVVNDLVAGVEGWSGASHVRDDVSVLAVEIRGD